MKIEVSIRTKHKILFEICINLNVCPERTVAMLSMTGLSDEKLYT
jgi:hypothetical protein